MRYIKGIAGYLLLTTILSISMGTIAGCQKSSPQTREAIVTFQLTPSSDGVDTFMELLGTYDSGYTSDTCYNVTPEDIQKKYGINIFKFDTSCNCFLQYENKVYPLGTGFGGLGATSFAVADLSGDGSVELYFTYSCGSGRHRSLAGYFDTASHEMIDLDFINYDKDSVLAVDNGQTLCLYDGECDVASFVDIKISAGDKLASIVWESGKITADKTAGQAD